MRRHLSAILGLATLLALATMPLLPNPALAAAPRDQGWWTVTNPGGLPTEPPAPPDVPSRGLLIQGGASAPSAFAAVLYELDPGVTASTLTLPVAPNSLTTPTAKIDLCALITPIVHPDQGGPISDAPAYNCSKKITAAADSSGKTFKFDVSGMVTDSLVAVALLPDGPTDRIVLNPPDDSSLATQQSGDAGTSAQTSPDVSADTAGSGASTALPSDSLSSTPFTASSPSGDVSLPSVSTGPSPAPAAAAAPSGSPNLGGTFVPAASSTPAKATPLLVLLFVVAALGGAALWLYAGRQNDAGLSGPAPG